MTMDKSRKTLLTIVVASVFAASPAAGAQENMAAPKAMGGMMMPGNAPVIPAVTGFADGQKILFLHTEASDPKIAKLLTDMMGSPVLVVPMLARVPEPMVARVYVFTNGITDSGPSGPLGFQPDVFDKPPGQPGYSPLRKIILVTWKDPASARILTSAMEVGQALAEGEIDAEEPGVIVNMPFLTWSGGQR